MPNRFVKQSKTRKVCKAVLKSILEQIRERLTNFIKTKKAYKKLHAHYETFRIDSFICNRKSDWTIRAGA